VYPTGIGTALSDARLARGLSYADAERETRIPRHHLEALEAEQFDAFPAPVYVRGFLRSYSQYLGLDSKSLLAKLPPERPAEPEHSSPVSRFGRRSALGARGAGLFRQAQSKQAAPPFVDAELNDAERETQDAGCEEAGSGRMHMPSDAFASQSHVGSTPLDPLGRLGWPEHPVTAAPAASRLEPRILEPDQFPRRERTATRYGANYGRAWQPVASPLPEDVRPLFSQRGLAGLAAVAVGIWIVWGLALMLGGAAKPKVPAAALRPQPAQVTVVEPSQPSVARGNMPDLRDQDFTSSIASLEQRQEIVPLVIQTTPGDLSTAKILGQAPAPGSALRSNTPVLLVVGQGG
jgi:hypothetical protein